jgi:hypothetical protein
MFLFSKSGNSNRAVPLPTPIVSSKDRNQGKIRQNVASLGSHNERGSLGSDFGEIQWQFTSVQRVETMKVRFSGAFLSKKSKCYKLHL